MAKPTEVFESIKTNLGNAYTSLENKRAVIPANKNIENLASAVDSIKPLLEDISVNPTTSTQIFTATGENDGIGKVTVNAVSSNIDSNIIPTNIRKGKSILGVVGNLEVDKPDQEKTVTPRTTAQDVVADYGYELSRVRVNAVDRMIDNNIQAGNIKKGVTILGVAGSFEGGIKPTGNIRITENGEHDVTNYSKAIVDVDGGGDYDIIQTISGDECELHIMDATNERLYHCKAIDYDGTVIKEKWCFAGEEFELPEFPKHENLVAQEWSATSPVVNNKIIVDRDIMAGVIYETKSGLTEFDVNLTPAIGKKVYLQMDGTKDWGDGTIDTNKGHTYAEYGKYTITCDGTVLASSKEYVSCLAQAMDEETFYCEAIRLGRNVTKIGDFYFTYGIKYITIPNNVVQMSQTNGGVFADGNTLILPNSLTSLLSVVFGDNIVIPHTVKSFEGISSYRCHELVLPSSLESIGKLFLGTVRQLEIPNSVDTIETLQLYSAEALEIPNGVTSVGTVEVGGMQKLVFADSVESIGTIKGYGSSNETRIEITLPNALSTSSLLIRNLNGLEEIRIPEGVTDFASNFISNCNRIRRISFPSVINSTKMGNFGDMEMVLDFRRSVAVPPLTISYLYPLQTVVVPDELYDEWVSAPEWVSHAAQIYKESEVSL